MRHYETAIVTIAKLTDLDTLEVAMATLGPVFMDPLPLQCSPELLLLGEAADT